MSTLHKQGNRPISESLILKAFAASTGGSRSTKVPNAETQSAGTCTCSSVMLSAEPSQNNFDVIEQHRLQLPAKKKKFIPVASQHTWLKKDLNTGGWITLYFLH